MSTHGLVGILLVIAWIHGLSPAQEVAVSLGDPMRIADPGVPVYPWFPDGHISFLKDGDQYQMYWAGSTSYRTLGPDAATMHPPAIAVLSKGAEGDADNGGAWLMSVFRQTGNALIGFYHAEDQEFDADPTSRFTAWKSIALCTSSDNGITWTKRGQIISSSSPKPSEPAWGGNGDHCVVWDSVQARWVCFYQEHYLMMAVSHDPDARPGSWYKYHNGGFTENGLGGKNSPIPSLMNHPGGNSSVHYNTHLKCWIMVWHTWEGQSQSPKSVWLSASHDLMTWASPQPLVAAGPDEKAWYPTIIGESDVQAGRDAWLLYAYWPDYTDWQRQFIRRSIHFENRTSVQAGAGRTAGDSRLEQNYPNPFNARTTIAYHLGKDEPVEISAWDAAGRNVATIVDGRGTQGRHVAPFDARGLATGIYCITMRTGNAVDVKKMILVK
jgi:hypothetical protein